MLSAEAEENTFIIISRALSDGEEYLPLTMYRWSLSNTVHSSIMDIFFNLHTLRNGL